MISKSSFRTKFLILTFFALVLLLPLSAKAAYTAEVKPDANNLNFRTGPSTASTVIEKLSAGTKLAIIGCDSSWYIVSTNGQTGYVAREYISSIPDCDFNIGAGTIKGNALVNLRSEPYLTGSILDQLSPDTAVDVIGISKFWFKVRFGSLVGYVHPDYLYIGSDMASPDPNQANTNCDLRNAVVSYAKSFLGTPYVYGGNGPRSFDCSGLTSYVMRHKAGLSLARSAAGQYASQTKISKADILPGDLVFFGPSPGSKRVTHVGMYIGGGQFIHASTSGYQVRINELNTGYYPRVFIGATRVIK